METHRQPAFGDPDGIGMLTIRRVDIDGRIFAAAVYSSRMQPIIPKQPSSGADRIAHPLLQRPDLGHTSGYQEIIPERRRDL